MGESWFSPRILTLFLLRQLLLTDIAYHNWDMCLADYYCLCTYPVVNYKVSKSIHPIQFLHKVSANLFHVTWFGEKPYHMHFRRKLQIDKKFCLRSCIKAKMFFFPESSIKLIMVFKKIKNMLNPLLPIPSHANNPNSSHREKWEKLLLKFLEHIFHQCLCMWKSLDVSMSIWPLYSL